MSKTRKATDRYLTAGEAGDIKNCGQGAIKTTLELVLSKLNLQCLQLILYPGIKMDIDAGKDCEESMLGSITDFHLVKMIVVQDSGVHSFCRSSVPVNLFPLFRPVWNRSEEPDVITVIDVYRSSISGRTALIRKWAGGNLIHPERAAEFSALSSECRRAIVIHRCSIRTTGTPFSFSLNLSKGIVPSRPLIAVDDWNNILVTEELKDGKTVRSCVKAHVSRVDIGIHVKQTC